jgi:chromosomal replication initiator protein
MIECDEIKRIVVAHFGLRPIEMVSMRRAKCVVRPRQIAMKMCEEYTPCSFPAIGRKFGNRDHTTVRHAVAVVTRLYDEDAELRFDVDAIRAKLDELSRSITF